MAITRVIDQDTVTQSFTGTGIAHIRQAVPSGDMLLAYGYCPGTINDISDSKGNAWTIRQQPSGNSWIWFADAMIATPLATTDTVIAHTVGIAEMGFEVIEYAGVSTGARFIGKSALSIDSVQRTTTQTVTSQPLTVPANSLAIYLMTAQAWDFATPGWQSATAPFVLEPGAPNKPAPAYQGGGSSSDPGNGASLAYAIGPTAGSLTATGTITSYGFAANILAAYAIFTPPVPNKLSMIV